MNNSYIPTDKYLNNKKLLTTMKKRMEKDNCCEEDNCNRPISVIIKKRVCTVHANNKKINSLEVIS